jgi:predicted short-subunit dehydrogenase-like oxidoreductase (DUF2520 family)
MSAVERVVIVGPGRAGTAVGRALLEVGHALVGVVGGAPASVAAARAEWGTDVPVCAASDALTLGTLVVVAAPDDRLPAAAAALGGAPAPATLVVHLAGASGLEPLAPCAARGARTAAFHPLRAFATRAAGRGGFGGAAVAVEATAADDRARLFRLAEGLDGRPFALDGAARPLYHAAAALAGNAPLALLGLAERWFSAAGAPPDLARAALLTLCRGALDNAERLGPAAALTGAVVRGDAATVARHLAAVGARDVAERDLYASLCAALVRLAAEREDGARARAVLAVLPEARA